MSLEMSAELLPFTMCRDSEMAVHRVHMTAGEGDQGEGELLCKFSIFIGQQPDLRRSLPDVIFVELEFIWS